MAKPNKKKKKGEGKSSLPWSDRELRRMRKATRMALVLGVVASKVLPQNTSIEL
ncbi:MAG: hypothetical protein WC761_06585 [Candidatus Paceibacterota bacterium]|jgi:hypothetical protein